jgi:hypothetical protein
MREYTVQIDLPDMQRINGVCLAFCFRFASLLFIRYCTSEFRSSPDIDSVAIELPDDWSVDVG